MGICVISEDFLSIMLKKFRWLVFFLVTMLVTVFIIIARFDVEPARPRINNHSSPLTFGSTQEYVTYVFRVFVENKVDP